MFLTIKKWTILYVLSFLLLFACFAGILWRGSAVQASRALDPAPGERVLILDPGHGGEDGGAVAGDGTVEAGINLSIARRLEAAAALLGRETVMTRREDVSLHDGQAKTLRQKKASDLRRRAELCGSVPGGVLVSIHQNSLPSAPSVQGAQVFYNGQGDSEALALALQDSLNQSVNGSRPKAAKAISPGIYLMEHASCPAVLVECGFLSNPEEAARLGDPGYQTRLALAILAGVEAHLGQQGEAGADPSSPGM